jgi:thiopeptide-type bacteriocin biosynthesis protein
MQSINYINLERTFIIGDEWIYYKFYIGTKSADDFLKSIIKPISEIAISCNWIDKWFFIRYKDPNFHLRVRFHLSSIDNFSNLILLVSSYTKPLLNDGIIWKVQIDTYERELERYGLNTIVSSESIFYQDSLVILNMLSRIKGIDGENFRWQFCLKSIDCYLNDFKLDTKKKFDFSKNMRNGFSQEFQINSNVKQQLSDKYRKNKKTIEALLSNNFHENEFTILYSLLEGRTERINEDINFILQLKKTNRLDISINDFLSSIIHMSINRIFKSNQRFHELVLYDFLERYYYSVLKKEEYKLKENNFDFFV